MINLNIVYFIPFLAHYIPFIVNIHLLRLTGHEVFCSTWMTKLLSTEAATFCKQRAQANNTDNKLHVTHTELYDIYIYIV